MIFFLFKGRNNSDAAYQQTTHEFLSPNLSIDEVHRKNTEKKGNIQTALA